jgi:hypothetical protein
MDYMILKTIVTSIAAASGNGTTYARAICPQAPGNHTQAHTTYLLPRGYFGKP